MKDDLKRMAEELQRKVVGRFGRRGTIALGLLLGGAFLAVGGPIVLASAGGAAVVFVVMAAVLLGPALWVLADARKRGVEHALLWALFALFGNVIGALVYILVRDDQKTQRPCGSCGRAVRSDHAACPFCGTLQNPVKRTCPKCRGELDVEWRFCPYCRTEVGGAA